MSDSIQTQGRTVDEAIAEACLQLGLRRDEVDVRVTQEAKSGLLGFIGGRPAKVVVRKKPERHRGGGRNHRSNDDGAHSLGRGRGGRSRGGRGRGGSGRGGRDGQQGEQQNNQRNNQNATGQNDNNAQAAKPDNERNNEGRGRSRGGRGRGRGRNNERQDSRYDGRGRSQNDSANSASNESGSSRQENNRDGGRQGGERQEGARQGSTRQGNTGQDSGRASNSQNDNSRRDGARAEERGGNDEQRRSRRGTRGGRGRSRRNNPENNPVNNEALSVEPTATPVTSEAPVVRQEEQAPRAAMIEKTTEQPTEPQSAPAASATEQPKVAPPAAPVVKKKRGGWGGGLGARLKSKSNPSVKEKPAATKVTPPSPELTAPVPTPTPIPQQERAPRYEERSRRPSDEIEEVIISGVKATKYASAATGVNEENLDATLTEMTNGVLARAGFSCEVEITDGEYRQVRITSDDESAGLLIGRHGQTVDAVEHLIERMVSNSVDDRVRMNLDINEYRQRRQDDLAARVADAVREVRESGRACHMESMSARERRLVHLEAENLDGIRTFTMSGNGGKHVVIAEDDESENDDRHDG